MLVRRRCSQCGRSNPPEDSSASGGQDGKWQRINWQKSRTVKGEGEMTLKARLASCGLMTAIAAGVVLVSVLVLPSTADAEFIFQVNDTKDESDAQPGDQKCQS